MRRRPKVPSVLTAACAAHVVVAVAVAVVQVRQPRVALQAVEGPRAALRRRPRVRRNLLRFEKERGVDVESELRRQGAHGGARVAEAREDGGEVLGDGAAVAGGEAVAEGGGGGAAPQAAARGEHGLLLPAACAAAARVRLHPDLLRAHAQGLGGERDGCAEGALSLGGAGGGGEAEREDGEEGGERGGPALGARGAAAEEGGEEGVERGEGRGGALDRKSVV